MKGTVTIFALGLGLLLASPARAEDASARVRAHELGYDSSGGTDSVSAPQMHFDAALGGSNQGFSLGGTGLIRWHVLDVGAGCQFSVLFSTRVGCGLLGGLTFDTPNWRLDALLEGGFNHIHTEGNFLTDDPGASGTIGYVGARIGNHWLFGGREGKRVRGSFGIWLFFQADLSGYEAHYQYLQSSSFFDQGGVRSGSQRVGNDAEIGLRIGGGFDYLAD